MATVFAVTKLYDDVVARFALEGADIANYFGWREPAKHKTAAKRIVWVPGDEVGALGAFGSAKNPGRNPRPLATLGELFYVLIGAVDASAPEDERKQYEATRALLDAWYRAAYLAARGTFSVVSAEWLTDKLERRHGAAIRVTCAIDAMVPDAPLESAPTDTKADISTTELDVTEHTETGS